MNMFEGCLVILSTIFQPTHVYFCSFQYLTLRRREVGKVIKAGAHFFFLNASFIADLRHAEFILALNESSFCSSFTE